MDKPSYIDIDGMQERADAAHKEHLNNEWDKVAEKTNEVLQGNKEIEAMWDRVYQNEVDEEEKKLAIEMEKEKDKAMKSIEDKYKRKGMKSRLADEKESDEDLRAMLKGLNEQTNRY